MKRALVIGIGSRDRADDAAGPVVCDDLASLHGVAADSENVGLEALGADVIRAGGDPARLIDLLSRYEVTVICDAVQSGSPTGTIHEFAAHDGPLPAELKSVSTHGMHPGQLVELARALGSLPPRTYVFGIEARSFETGGTVDARVREACRKVALRISELLKREVCHA